MSAAGTMLEVEELSVEFRSAAGVTRAVDRLSFSLGRERLAIVGESGSGKSQAARAVLGLTPPAGTVSAKRMNFSGIDLRALRGKAWRAVRGKRISMILQDPKYSLNPVMTIGAQIAEAYRNNVDPTRAAARDAALAMLQAVRIEDPKRVFGLYPHEVSGGMGQRAMIAMMLISDPELLIADEPTSALDVGVQHDVIRLLDDLVASRGLGLIMITHDLKLVSRFCDRVIVMYRGRMVESLRTAELTHAQHPYTRGLLRCVPSLSNLVRPLPTIDRRELEGRA